MNLLANPEILPSSSKLAGSSSPVGGLEVGDVVRILSERRQIVLGGALLGIIAAIAVSLLMTPLYRASALLELNSPATDVIADASGQHRTAAVNTQEMVQTQLGLLNSDSLARRIVEDLNLLSQPGFADQDGTREQKIARAVAVLHRNSMIEAVKGSALMRVSYSSPDRVLAARVANALAEGFIASSLERRYDSSSYARDFLRNQLASTKAALENSERQLNAYALESGIVRTPGQVINGTTTEGASISANDLAALNTALNDAHVRRVNAEQAYRNGAVGQNATAVAAATSSGALRQQRATLQAEYDDKAKLFKDDYPEMRQLESRIAALDRAIAGERSAGNNGAQSDLLAEYRAAEATEAQLASRVAALKRNVQSERGKSIEYNILQREVDTNRALYDALLQRYKEIGVAGGIGQSDVSIVDKADPPQAPYRPNMPLNAIIGLLLGAALGVGGAVIAHLLLDHIVSPADVRSRLGLPVLGVIPAEPDGRSLFEAIEDRKSDISEAYFSVRTALQFVGEHGTPRSLLLTSTRPGEGKSTSAYAIASSFARTGMNVLLIDADLRKPTFISHDESRRGLASLLGSDEPLASSIEKTKSPNLSLLPVGRFTGSAAELLGSPRLSRIAAEAITLFDLVVIDGPPVLGLADAPLLGAVAEKAIMVIQSGEARTANVLEMIKRLQASGTDLCGTILTKVRRNNPAFGYNYYSYNYGDSSGEVSSDPNRAIDINAGPRAGQ